MIPSKQKFPLRIILLHPVCLNFLSASEREKTISALTPCHSLPIYTPPIRMDLSFPTQRAKSKSILYPHWTDFKSSFNVLHSPQI